MGQIQNAVGSLVGSAAAGAIAKQKMDKIKQESETAEQALKSTQEDVELTNETIASGVDPLTGENLSKALQMQKTDPEFYSSISGMPFDESKATAANGLVGKQSQFKTSQMKAVRNKIKGGKR